MPTRRNRYEVGHHSEITSLRATNTVVVGNGPAALFLSYLLHGNVPVYDPDTHGPHPDPILHEKLSKFVGKPLFDALDSANACERLTDHFTRSNLSYSTQALPVNTLLDTLLRPNADVELGDLKSRIKWDRCPDNRVDHIVLGSAAKAGGQWNEEPVSTNCNIGTLSYSEMFSLPGYSFPLHYRQLYKKPVPEFIRPARCDVSSYYSSYPKSVGISSTIYSGVYVKRISRNPNGFTVQVQRRKTAEIFVILCKQLVLASGIFSFTIPPPPIFLPLLQNFKPFRAQSEAGVLLVIGSGFTAADVILSQPPGKIIIHIYKWNPDRPSPLKGCHPQAYPEYAEVYRRMKFGTLPPNHKHRNDPSKNDLRNWDSTYEALPNSQVIAVSGEGSLRILTDDDKVIERNVDELKYCVGRRGSLGYLSSELRNEVGVIDVAWVSAETLRRRVEAGVEVSKNLFIIGSLTGDSLVRYAMGGCTYAAGRIIRDIQAMRDEKERTDGNFESGRMSSSQIKFNNWGCLLS